MSNCYETQLHFYITNHCIDVNICVPVYFVYEFNKINKKSAKLTSNSQYPSPPHTYNNVLYSVEQCLLHIN